MKAVLYTLAAVGIAMLVPSARAETAPPESNILITALSGKTTKLDFVYSLNQDCSSKGNADILVKSSPHNGQLSVKSGHDHPKFSPDSNFHKCNAKLVPSAQFYYQSNPGYVGNDTLSVEVTFPDGDKIDATFIITVK